MPELLAPVDVEGGIIALLMTATPNVSTEVPNPRPETESYIRVTSTGGSIRNLVQLDARLLVECWAADETTALNLARHAWALLFSAIDTTLQNGVYVTRIDSTGPVNFPDPDTKSARYQFITTVTTSLEEYS